MRTNFRDIWRTYRWSPELWQRYVERLNPQIRSRWRPIESKELQEQILAFPIFRTLTNYCSYGMTPIAMAAITRQEPIEVWKQLKREQANYIDWCSSTHLPVMDKLNAIRKLTAASGRVKKSFYASHSLYIGEKLGLPLEAWLRGYPLRKCSVNFHRIKTFYPISPEERRYLRRAFTLGLSPEEAEPYLLTPEEEEKLLAVEPVELPKVISPAMALKLCLYPSQGTYRDREGFTSLKYIPEGYEAYHINEGFQWASRLQPTAGPQGPA